MGPGAAATLPRRGHFAVTWHGRPPRATLRPVATANLLSREQLLSRTAQHLAWADVLESIAGHCLSAPARMTLEALMPEREFESTRARLLVLRQGMEAHLQDVAWPRQDLADLDPALDHLERGGTIDLANLAHIAAMLSAAAPLRSYAQRHRGRWPQLCAGFESSSTLDRLRTTLTRCLDADGGLSDQASPELHRVRRRVEDLRRESKRMIERLANRHQDLLRETAHTERDGRLVLTVRADAHLRIPGLVLGASTSGNTLYVEPPELTPLGNQLRLALDAELREQARILEELSAELRAQLDALREAYDSCIRADTLGAVVRWARLAEATVPQLQPRPLLELKGLKHPLLAVSAGGAVPSDVTLEAGKVLIVSGPNAGGKTVLLKSVGLAVWMLRAGLPVVAEELSIVGWFDPVLTDLGDDQSLSCSLSTFSAHVTNLASILQFARPGFLALLDEVAAGTDPEEGSALAAAILEDLVEQGGAAIVTTHYEPLKQLGASHACFSNGSVGFDLDSFTPSYRFHTGAPGPSTALAVAARYGIAARVVERARSLVPKESVDRERLIRELESERTKMYEARRAAEADRYEQSRLLAEAREERQRIVESERARLEKDGALLYSELRAARAELAAVRKRLKQSEVDERAVAELSKDLERAAGRAAVGSPIDEALRKVRPSPTLSDGPPSPASLVAGAVFWLPRLSSAAQVLEPPQRGQVRVQVGALRLLADAAELRPMSAAPKRTKEGPRKQKAPPVALPAPTAQALRTSDNTLDLRGWRVEEGLDEVDRFLDRLLQVHESVAFVLHGHGTGAMKAAVRAHLMASSLVERSRPAESDEGGDAFTVAWLTDH